MSLTDRLAQARFDRGARKAAREQHLILVRELASYSTPADRTEIELIAARNPGPDADLVLDILDRVATDPMRQAA